MAFEFEGWFEVYIAEFVEGLLHGLALGEVVGGIGGESVL
jgi:hypothetical protein